MISKRGLIAAGALGVGSALLATTSAFACSINDFTVDSSVTCDQSSGQGTITVTDHDGSDTSVNISVTEQGSSTVLGTGEITPQNGSGSTTITVPWQSGATYTVHVQTVQGSRFTVNADSNTHPTAPATDCGAVKPTETAQPTPTTTSTPTTTPTATPTSKTAPVSTTTAAPSPSQSSPGSSLAETGGGSNTGPMIGIAAALVLVGGAAVVINRRRTARNH